MEQGQPHYSDLAKVAVVKSKLELDLFTKVEAVVAALDLELRDVEVIGTQNPTIRVSVDHPLIDGARKGVGLEDCSRVHKKLGPMFDLWDPVSGPYTLECSSPGETAPIVRTQHFHEAMGDVIRFETTEAIPLGGSLKPRKRWKSTLVDVDWKAARIAVEDDLGRFQIPLSKLSSVQWLRSWDKSTSPYPNPKKNKKKRGKKS